MFFDQGYGLSWSILHVYLKRMCILLFWSKMFYKTRAVGWQYRSGLLYSCWFSVYLFNWLLRGMLKFPCITVNLCILFPSVPSLPALRIIKFCLSCIHIQDCFVFCDLTILLYVTYFSVHISCPCSVLLCLINIAFARYVFFFLLFVSFKVDFL